MEIGFPSSSSTTWSQEIGVFSLERDRTAGSSDGFASQFESRKAALQSQHHEKEVSLLSDARYDVDGTSILLSRSSPVDTYTYIVDAYAWRGDGGYRLRTTIASEEREQVDSLLGFVANLEPIGPDHVLSGRDFCFDGVSLTSPAQRVFALVQAPLPRWREANVWVSVLENESVAVKDVGDIRYDLEREKEAARSLAEEDPGAMNDPSYPRRFDELRSGKRVLNGIDGREIVWKKELNSGVKVYHLRWQADSEPNGASIGMDVGSEDDPVPTPAEVEILGVWDAITATLRYR